ncbi:citrate transporter [bacterium]|nr:citrate transporter [bacterium]
MSEESKVNRLFSRPVMIGIFSVLLFISALLFVRDPLFQQSSSGQWLFLSIPVEFILFGLTLLCVALFHHYVLQVALTGLAVILTYKLSFTSFDAVAHIHHEWAIVVNLLGLLVGFAILAKHFEESHIPEILPKHLPNGMAGPLVLLCITFVLSSFLDNIAAAMIGGTIALTVFRGKVHIGFLAAIVAASNAGGAGSVLGDTTTTMMWIDGVSPWDVLHAYYGSIGAFAFFAIVASIQQNKLQTIIRAEGSENHSIDWGKILVVALILVGAIATNILLDFPALGVWVAIFIGAFIRKTAWHEIPVALKGSIFLVSLVLSASMMPVDQLPPAAWFTTFILGFVSSVFDNIPLTKLALDQGGYDWGVLAYAVGYGGSMIWFGSSAGVAISGIFPKAKSVVFWLKDGWHVAVGYVIGFFIMLALWGWEPHENHKTEKSESLKQPSTEQTH